ncbi:MAG: hypothetical protein ACRDTC_28405 [Pseudonocardiaceae bacterium]
MSRWNGVKKAGAAIALTATVMGLTATQAQALGNRTVDRHCGSNYISSWNSGGNGYVETTKVSGSCAGPVGAGYILTNGQWGPSVFDYNSPNSILVIADGENINGGHHYGCPTCNYSIT